ncbi:MAG: acylphosphatase [Archaeoglobaceae archaeon]
MLRLEAYISGVVQGVGFRYFARKMAKESGVTGFVMNLNDGRVFLVAEGSGEQLEKFISTIRQGPVHGIVKKVETAQREATGEFTNFNIRY